MGRVPLAPDEEQRRIIVHNIAQAMHGKLVMFGFVDEHGHVVVFDEAGHLAHLKRSLAAAFDRGAGVVEEVWSDPVRGRSHVLNLLRYQSGQTFHHGIPVHPALWTASSFLDLVGARFIEGLHLRLFEALPRFSVEDLPPLVGLPRGRIAPASDETIRTLGATRLKRAAAAALAADPELRGRDLPACRARRVVACLARKTGIETGEAVWALKRAAPVVQRLARRSVDPAWESATRVRITLEERVQDQINQSYCVRMIREHAERKTKSVLA